MPFEVRLRNNATGEIRTVRFDFEYDEYSWTDGNFGCDCNRSDFFAEAGGEEVDDQSPCGEHRFTAIGIDWPRDWPWPTGTSPPRPAAPPRTGDAALARRARAGRNRKARLTRRR